MPTLSIAITPRKLRLLFLGGGAIALAWDAGGADTLADDPTAAVNFTWTLMAEYTEEWRRHVWSLE